MKGRVLSYQKCPKCNKPFTVLKDEMGIMCLDCLTVPNRIYINANQLKMKRMYSDPRGVPFDSFKMAHRQLESMRLDWDNKNFDPEKYDPRKVAEYLFQKVSDTWLKEYEIEVRRGKKANSYVRKLRQRMKDYIIPYFKDYDIREIKKHTVKKFYIHLLESSGKADKTIKHILTTLHTFLAAHIENVPRFPKFNPLPKQEKRTMDEVNQMLALSFVREPFSLPIRTCQDTGIRTGECRALKKKDLMFFPGYLAVQRAFSESEYREETKEGNTCYKPKIVPVSPEIYKKLTDHAALLQDDDFLFTYKGSPLNKNRLNDEWKDGCNLAKIDPIPITNSTRHSRATNMMKKRMEQARTEASNQLGHSNEQTTEKHYIVLDP